MMDSASGTSSVLAVCWGRGIVNFAAAYGVSRAGSKRWQHLFHYKRLLVCASILSGEIFRHSLYHPLQSQSGAEFL